MRTILLLLPVLLISAFSAFAQTRTCASHEVLEQQMLQNPLLRQVMEGVERHTEHFIKSGGVRERAVVTIPVVVNVVWNTTSENISDAQIQSQIDILNRDFRRLNSDWTKTPAVWQPIAADCEINFCLATQDPGGAATTGIRRRQTTTTAFSSNDDVKFNARGGLDAWDRNKYLNLWICDLSGGLLGYAQFPGGTAATDGVVCDYQYVGNTGTATAPFNLGRTATHEVGHWLNLRHIWGDDGTGCTGSDQVADTPNQGGPTSGCFASGTVNISCSNGPNGNMWMNYMDYTDDACMYMFSAGQRDRMQAVFAAGGPRAAIVSSPGCQPPLATCGTPSGLNATGIAQTSATLNWSAVNGAVSYNLQWKTAAASTFTTVSGLTGVSYNLTGLTAGTDYSFQVQAVCSANTGVYSAAAGFTTQSAGGGTCSDIYESNNSRSNAKTIAVNQNITALIGSSTDVDWFRFSNSASTPNIRIDLTNLPANYNLQLNRSSVILKTSSNSGTTNEQIIYNTATVSSNYHTIVSGANGAFNAAQCYTLRVTLSSSVFRQDGTTDGVTREIEVPLGFEENGFTLYPNPASSSVVLEVALAQDSEVAVSFVDLSGRPVLEQQKTLVKGEHRFEVDTEALTDGLYFVLLRSGETVHTRKVVIRK